MQIEDSNVRSWHIEDWHYLDGPNEPRVNGAVLPYSTDDRLQKIVLDISMGNKRLGATAMISRSCDKK